MSKPLPCFYLIARKKHGSKTVPDSLWAGCTVFSKNFRLSLIKAKRQRTEDGVHVTAFFLEGG